MSAGIACTPGPTRPHPRLVCHCGQRRGTDDAWASCRKSPTLSPGSLILGDVRQHSGFLYEQVRQGDIRPTTDADAKHRTHDSDAPPRVQSNLPDVKRWTMGTAPQDRPTPAARAAADRPRLRHRSVVHAAVWRPLPGWVRRLDPRASLGRCQNHHPQRPSGLLSPSQPKLMLNAGLKSFEAVSSSSTRSLNLTPDSSTDPTPIPSIQTAEC